MPMGETLPSWGNCRAGRLDCLMPQRGGGDSDLRNSGPADSCVLAGRLKLDLRGAFGGGGNSLRPIFTGLVFSAMVKWSSTVPVDLDVLAPDLGFDNATIHSSTKEGYVSIHHIKQAWFPTPSHHLVIYIKLLRTPTIYYCST
jgi:hypothetical protein